MKVFSLTIERRVHLYSISLIIIMFKLVLHIFITWLVGTFCSIDFLLLLLLVANMIKSEKDPGLAVPDMDPDLALFVYN